MIIMDDKTKDKFKETFGPDVIFEDDDQVHEAAKRMQVFVLNRMKPCTHKVIQHEFPLDPRIQSFACKCRKIHYLEISGAAADELLMDKDLRNVDHKVKDHKLIEFMGIEVRIV